jgi:hypothetical protein
MSVTFTAAASPVIAYTIGCGFHDNGLTDHTFTTFPEALTFIQAERATHGSTGHLIVCGDDFCAEMGASIEHIEESPAPKINVSFALARHLLRTLDFKPDTDGYLNLRGTSRPSYFYARVLAAQTLTPREETPESGRPEGYTLDRLAELREMARFAMDTGREVQWS